MEQWAKKRRRMPRFRPQWRETTLLPMEAEAGIIANDTNPLNRVGNSKNYQNNTIRSTYHIFFYLAHRGLKDYTFPKRGTPFIDRKADCTSHRLQIKQQRMFIGRHKRHETNPRLYVPRRTRMLVCQGNLSAAPL